MTLIDINKELSQNFLDFSYEANSQRAFADARDGLKPGQRACLWEMYTKGYLSNKPHVKSAKISGGTVASWWPHGTTAIYDTFARMSQPWINNIPEVDWHGANGSIQISGEPAADRYTEARLSKTTEEGLLFGIKKNNVLMKLNFSEDQEWPEVLPAIYPRLLVNGCQGIGSTIANVFLPHSLDELAISIKEYIRSGKIDYSILAPSFPTGGIIINKDELEPIYKTGKGKVILRGKTEIIKNCIQITEMPYQVYVEPFIDQVKQLISKEEINGIDNIINKSNKKQLLIEIECSDSPLTVLNQLFQKTDLQKTFNANQYALVGKTPKLLNYQQYLDIFLNHNYDCIQREYNYDLEKSKKRLEIVLGLIKALEDIDNIISLIKKSDNSKSAIDNLIKQYDFTKNQAQAIVDMKLGRLAHLEVIELNKEKENLTSTISNCEDVISNLNRRQEIFLDRFNAFIKKYPNPRKTQLAQIKMPSSKEEKEIINVEPEKCVVITTASGNIKRIPISSFRIQKRNGKGVKTQDDITDTIIRTNTIDSLLIFSNKGNVYRLLVNDIPEGTNSSKGQPITSLIEMLHGEKPTIIYSAYRDTDAEYIFFVTKKGLAKKTSIKEYTSIKKKNGTTAIKLKENDEIAAVALIKNESIILTSSGGNCIHFNSKEVAASGRVTMGVKAMALKEDEEIECMAVVREPTDNLAVFAPNGIARQIPLKEFPIQKRAGKGIKIGEVIDMTLIAPGDILLVSGQKKNICIAANDIPVLSRMAQGNQIIKNDRIISVSKI